MSSAASQKAAELNVQHEELGRHVPIAAQYLELRDKVFAIADDLGIGKEIRTLYHNMAFGTKAGTAVGVGVAAIASGGAFGSFAAGGAAAGGAMGAMAGAVVGAVVAVFDLFGSDDDEIAEARRKAKKAALDAYEKRLLAPLTLEAMVSEQNAIAKTSRGTLDGPMGPLLPPGIKAMATANLARSEALVKLYAEVPKKLRPTDLELFVIGADIGRLEWALSHAPYWPPLLSQHGHKVRETLQRNLDRQRRRLRELTSVAFHLDMSVRPSSTGSSLTWLAFGFAAYRLAKRFF